MLKKIIALSLSSLICSYSLACSSVFIGSNNIGAVGRTMDFPQNTDVGYVFGTIGTDNTSNINLSPESLPAATWTNQYPYIGKDLYNTPNVVDGMNNQGLYAGLLYLPGVTKYPSNENYDRSDKRELLGIGDLSNFVLGTSATVPEALQKIAQYKLVANAFKIKQGIHFTFPIHLVLHDKLGNSAVIEWLNSKTNVYFHQAGTNNVSEKINGELVKTFDNFDASVVTNSPEYSWQIENAKKYDYVYNGNTAKTFDGLSMNGSGMYQLPGDFTPPSRLARGYQISRLMPKVQDSRQALFETQQVLNSMLVPVDTNPSPTVWSTISDLSNNVYYYKKILNVKTKSRISDVNSLTKSSEYEVLDPMNNAWIKYDLNKMDPYNVPHKDDWYSATITRGNTASLHTNFQNWVLQQFQRTPANIIVIVKLLSAALV